MGGIKGRKQKAKLARRAKRYEAMKKHSGTKAPGSNKK